MLHEWIDFTRSDLNYRRQFGGGRQQDIAKAVGLKHRWCPHVVDCTAGLGRDSFLLASLGCQVTLLERHPTVASELALALEAARAEEDIAPIIARMHLYNEDAKIWLAAHDTMDVVYLDPMFPQRRKSALVKKEMRVLRDIVGDDLDIAELLDVALEKAVYRVVVKRPRIGDKIGGVNPSFVLEGKANRFDVYVKKAIPTG